MFLRIKKLRPVYFLVTGVALKADENVSKLSQSHSHKDSYLTYDSLTPWERVKDIFRVSGTGKTSEDYALISNSTCIGIIFGAMIGASKRGLQSLQNFMEHNDATKFANAYDARSKLGAQMSLGMIKGATSMGLRLGFIVGTYMLITTCAAVYRGKNGILEHLVGGTVMGTLYRINYGLRGMIVGGSLGLLVGTMYGVSTYFILKVAGIDFDEYRRENYNLYTWTSRMERKVMDSAHFSDRTPLEQRKMLETKDLPLTLDGLPDEPEESNASREPA